MGAETTTENRGPRAVSASGGRHAPGLEKPWLSAARAQGIHKPGFWLLFTLLALVSCYPLWHFPYFPSQDGPAHLHNATVLANYDREPIYRDYYDVQLSAAGHLLTEVLLVLLVHVTAPLLAEKLILTTYIVLFAASLRYFSASIHAPAHSLSLLAFLFLPNFFLYMGFFNFYASIPLMLFGMGYYLRHHRRWDGRSLAIFSLLSLLTYAAHLMSWAILAGSTVLLIAADLRSGHRRTASRRAAGDLLRPALPATGLLLPAILFLAYLAPHNEMYSSGVHPHVVFAKPPLRLRAWDLYGMSFLHTIAPSDLRIAQVIAALTCVLLALAVLGRLRNFRWRAADACLLPCAALTALLLIRPLGSIWAYYLPERVALYAWLFLAAWLAAQPFPRFVSRSAALLICGLAVLGTAGRLPAHRFWNERLQEFASAGPWIQPQKTVLKLQIGAALLPRINPLVHAGGIFAPKAYVDLANFEPATDHFMVRFRPDKVPFKSLGSLHELDSNPPRFDVLRYEQSTSGRVDYLLFFGDARAPEDSPEGKLFTRQLAGYDLVYVSKPFGRTRLYRLRPEPPLN